MNSKIENKFIDLFINKEKKERLKFELSKEKKRKIAIMRFCHNTSDMIKKSYIYKETNSSDVHEIYRHLKNISKSNFAYIISYDEEIDGTEKNLTEAIEACLYIGMPSIVILENTALIITEQEIGSSKKYILHAK